MPRHPRISVATIRSRAGVVGGIVVLALVAAAPICGPADPTPTTVAATPTAVAVTLTTVPPRPPTPVAEQNAPSTPTSSSSPSASKFGYPKVSSLPSPSSQDDAMFIGGLLWVDGTTPEGEVIAYIGGKECGRGKSFTLPGGGFPTLLIVVPSEAQQLGCGTTGAQVTLAINGRAMEGPIDWQPGFQQPRQFFIGPVVAQYLGDIRFDKSAVPLRVVPYVDGVVCGGQVNPMQGDGEAGYQVVVQPAELRPGCGRDGVVITLRLEGKTVDGRPLDIVIDSVAWKPGVPVQRQAVDLAAKLSGAPIPTVPAVQ